MTVEKWIIADGTGKIHFTKFHRGLQYTLDEWQTEQLITYRLHSWVMLQGKVRFDTYNDRSFKCLEGNITPVPNKQQRQELRQCQAVVEPTYKLKNGADQGTLRVAIAKVLSAISAGSITVDDPLPPVVTERYGLLGLVEAMVAVHQPSTSHEMHNEIQSVTLDP